MWGALSTHAPYFLSTHPPLSLSLPLSLPLTLSPIFYSLLSSVSPSPPTLFISFSLSLPPFFSPFHSHSLLFLPSISFLLPSYISISSFSCLLTFHSPSLPPCSSSPSFSPPSSLLSLSCISFTIFQSTVIYLPHFALLTFFFFLLVSFSLLFLFLLLFRL